MDEVSGGGYEFSNSRRRRNGLMSDKDILIINKSLTSNEKDSKDKADGRIRRVQVVVERKKS